MEDLIDVIVGRSRRQRSGDGLFGDLLGTIGRWVRTCGCIVILAIIVAVAAVAGGVVKLTDDQITIVIVFITMIVAVASLIRTSMGY